ncbi:amidohydrolase [Candidatus Magnetaquicoccus inordinatus]|uniref:amidohydrolase n=1 Tax=Candidatus Magnetaquicoccus inordinatus TaxID=2496818 RepID=UPI00102B7935|nr:amidohydrolase [Candidatus Magnetaquicoccus inordinatus]
MILQIDNVHLPEQGLVSIQVADGRIHGLGADLVCPPEAERWDGEGMVLVPGLVNGHTHAAMTLFRGFGDDMPLMEWLQTRIWPAEARLSEEDVYWGTRLACLEMIRSGTLCFTDMYWHFPGVARAVEESGMRALLGAVMIDVAGEEQARHCQRMTEEYFEQAQQFSSRIQFTLTPHAIYTVSRQSLQWVRDFAERHQLPIQIHLSETRHEVEQCLQQQGLPPALYLDQIGLLHERVILAHGVHLNDAELDRIALRGATLVTNPVSNMKLAVGGSFPYRRAAQRAIPMALGTDGAASNNSLDLFQEMKVMSLLQKHSEQDPTLLPAEEAWAIATGKRAPLLGQNAALAVGEAADFLLLRLDGVEVTPNHHLYSNLVYAATGYCVDTAVVAGRVLMRQRQIADAEEIVQQARLRAQQICQISS